MPKNYWWTYEEIDYIEECSKKGYSLSKIARVMSEEFKIEYTRAQVVSIYRRYVKTGLRPKFSGEARNNLKDLGTERKSSQGYTRVKVGEGKWELKHRALYKKYNGEIPKDYAVIFANGDKNDYRKENLIAVSREKLGVINGNKLMKNNIETTKTVLILADIIIKMRKLENKEA